LTQINPHLFPVEGNVERSFLQKGGLNFPWRKEAKISFDRINGSTVLQSLLPTRIGTHREPVIHRNERVTKIGFYLFGIAIL